MAQKKMIPAIRATETLD